MAQWQTKVRFYVFDEVIGCVLNVVITQLFMQVLHEIIAVTQGAFEQYIEKLSTSVYCISSTSIGLI
jgi:hypothetical protein